MSGAKQSRFLRHLEPLKDALVAYCRRMAWHPDDRDDILQTALTTAFADFDAYAEGTNFNAWIFKHLQFACFNVNRKRRPDDELPADGAGAEPCAYDQLDQELSYHLLLRQPDVLFEHFDDKVASALRALTGTERAALLLRSVGGLSYQEIAGILSVPVGTVMSSLCRAREKMRERITSYAQQAGWQHLTMKGRP